MKTTETSVRPPAVAGRFYPAETTALREQVHSLLAATKATAAPAIAAIVPHAGLAYSGPCAAEVFARIRFPRTVVILGPNHYDLASQKAGASVWRSGAFATPLGLVPVDETFSVQLLESCRLVAHDPMAHSREHSIEVELPFLIEQSAPRHPAIVPIVLRWDDWPQCSRLAAALVELAQRREPGDVVLVASSDMTHFEPAAIALQRDMPALAAIGRLDGAGLVRVCEEERITMCGRAPAAVVIEAARRLGATRVDVVAHTHSGIASGDHSSVVSYAGIVIR